MAYNGGHALFCLASSLVTVVRFVDQNSSLAIKKNHLYLAAGFLAFIQKPAYEIEDRGKEATGDVNLMGH